MNDSENVSVPLTRDIDSVIQYQERINKLSGASSDSSPLNPEYPSESDSATIERRKKKGEKRTFATQFRAIIRKNFALQAKQRGTNCCQICTPIVCLLFILLIQKLASGKLTGLTISLNFPFIYNVPYEKIYGDESLFFGNSPPLNLTTCLQWYLYDFSDASNDTIAFVGDQSDGMLSRRFPPAEALKELYQCEDLGLMPYFQTPTNGSINNQLYTDMEFLNTLSYRAPRDVPMLSLIPDGAVTFYEANANNLTVNIQINDLRLYEYHRANGITRYGLTAANSTYQVMNIYDGQMILFDLITNAYAQSLPNNSYYIISGSQVMPESESAAAILAKIISLVGSTLYPIALSLLLPVFMYTIVLEKEERLREIMKMNGLKMTNYWVVNYIWCLGLYIVSVVLFVLFGRFVIRTDFFLYTNFGVLSVSLLGWGLSQVSLSIFFQNFVSKARTAIIAGYLLALWTTIFAVTYSLGVYPIPDTLPVALIWYPAVAFVRLIYYLTNYCGNSSCISSFSQFNDEMNLCLIILYVAALVFLVLGIYLDQVLPQEYGVRKHPLFFIKWFKNKIADKKTQDHKNESNSVQDNIGDKNAKNTEDEDVHKEREKVANLESPFDRYPLVIKNLRKVYKAIGGKPPKVAVKNFSLHMKRGEMFGLLGPNGAGKTSLISMLTGLYSPESGDAWVGGYSILNQIDSVHMEMGVCPQFDLLWPDLTVEEHLLFYARIRGVPTKDEQALVDKAIKEVYLTKFKSFRTKQLSGGMKRRLSVALSLVGDPQIVFLDEPTTGLDPENRRQLWDILVEARGQRAMVLTTHSMEEADVLCTRIGIITDGVLRCIGPQTRLKSKYGGGYHLFINCHKDKYYSRRPGHQRAQSNTLEDTYLKLQKYITTLLPKAQLKSSFNGNFIFLVPLEGLEVSEIFELLESRKEELGIADWGISQSTLEDVFMEIVETSESFQDDDLN